MADTPVFFEGTLPIEDGGVVDRFHIGIPLTAEGRVCIALGGTTSYVNNGVPFDSAGRCVVVDDGDDSRLVIGSIPYLLRFDGDIEGYYQGLPFGEAGGGGGGGGFGDDFAMTGRTTSASEVFTIRCRNFGTFNALIDWGDGSSSTITSYNDPNLNHTYLSPGDYQIRISGVFPSIRFDSGASSLKVIRVDNMGNTGWLVLEDAFKGCRNLTEVLSNGNVDTSSVINMRKAFRDCSKLTTCDVSGWDTSSCFFLSDMFRGCSSLLELDVSTWDTSLVTSASSAFDGCWALTTLDVSGWDTSSMRFMSSMFSACFILNPLTISGWDITAMTSASNFMLSSNNALTQAEYDATLIAWEAQAYNPNVTISFGDATYSAGAAATARAALVANGWNITDGGEA